MFTRRTFLKYTGGTVLTLFAVNRFGVPVAIAQIPGGSLDPGVVPKFQTPLLIPPVMPKAALFTQFGGKRVDYYEIALRQLSQQILPAGLPATTVWGYGAVAAGSKRGLRLHNAPSLTIEATWNTPVRVKWINDLKDAAGNFLPHLLPVDPTLHWANPPGSTAGRDTRPTFSSTPAPYTGPVPMITHVHGAVGVGDESDGYAEAWYLPDASNIPADFAREGSWYEFFAGKALAKFGETWGPGFATFQYPNTNRASTLWYHDHTLGMTRLNVYAGPAGFYLVRGGPAGDAAVLDTRSGTPALLPGPAPKANDKFPPNKSYYEIPVAIQDRSFNADGSLFYPDSRAFFDDIAGPFIPDSDISPLWNPEFFGNMLMVNGTTWPFHTVEQVRYRLRMLNGCQSRFLILDFNAIPGVEVWQIGNEGGFLAAPVNLSADHGNRLLMGLAERADLIVDFGQVPPGNYVLGNVGPDEPFSGGEPGDDFDMADPDTTGQVMQLRVVPAVAADPSTPPQFLQLPAITPLAAETFTRRLVLLEEMSAFFADAPAEALLGTLAGDPAEAPVAWSKHLWMEPVSENPALGATEAWELYNATGDAHPMHIHEVVFEVIDRQDIFVDEQAETVQLAPGSLPTPAEPWETGFKDTVIAYPGQVTRLRAQFNTPGQFVWHCHIVEHEDNEMMRPYRIGPHQPGQPG
ncbi:Multicopper oxidase with three cupredoxin domains (Includes cell division protein FtsP and spore coat protein CotA) [Pseudomonas sp. 8AS]|uniref:multicopper oxidase family protein n=1 Tax=Pseudomonas sp. 8AS TaxID=2653163 RepID=UPI0012F45FD2|nr:multicopper oxidase [Pseudomonas sp. 8AS]VXC37020.1 Multicopper oxidase with three cupredoxin domains (Includes cell division protein FtsP and spore coat protein CotA) [Pseudomonas sp. 8AS]